MLRAPAALSLLAVLAAGCGGAPLQSLAQLQAKFLGDSHARVVRMETFRLVNGDRDFVAQMRGHFTIVPSCPVPAGHHRSGCHPFHTRYAVIEFGKAGYGFRTSTTSGLAARSRPGRRGRHTCRAPA